jgi:hypothetical protein
MLAETDIVEYAVEIQRQICGRNDQAEEQWDEWERLRRRLTAARFTRKSSLTELWRAYEEETGTTLGCD